MTDGLVSMYGLGLLAVALAASAAMGASIQHGGTCMVGAVDRLIQHGRTDRFIALIECSVWTSALGLIALGLGLPFHASPNYPANLGALAGGLVLGIGAWLNGACVFGSIARIGSRDWLFLLTPPGFWLGSLIHAKTIGHFAMAVAQPAESTWPRVLVGVAALLSLIYSLSLVSRGWRQSLDLRRLWDFRHATIAIGIAFVVLASLAGPWTYTEALARAAHGGRWPGGIDLALFLALLVGAIVGGRGSAAKGNPSIRRGICCLGGGTLMGFGSSMVPGGNDNLILVGLPGLQPHAWLAIGAMIFGIAVCLLIDKGLRR